MTPTTRARGPVLLVDDDKDLLQLIAMRLTASGYAVTAVESGEAALASLAVARPQVVVTDLRMHGMDGMALFDAIHRDAPSLPVVILTAHGTIPEAVAATRRGVFSFLTKPFEPKVLLETVADALRLSAAPSGEVEEWRSELITRSAAMEALLAQARRVRARDPLARRHQPLLAQPRLRLGLGAEAVPIGREVVVVRVDEALQQLQPSRGLRPASGLELLADLALFPFLHDVRPA